MIAKMRSWFYERKLFPVTRLPAFVLSVGNISMGGTGKSPFVMLLAERAVAAGVRTAVLSRGYKRASEELVIVGPNEVLPGVDLLGDEPLMIKKRVPGISLLVHADRGRMAEKNWAKLGAPELVILDDGFQHWKLARDRDVVMIDSAEPIHGAAVPLGPLREEVSSLGRADLAVVTRADSLGNREREVLATQLKANLENRTKAPWKISGSSHPSVLWADYRFSGFADLQTGEELPAPGTQGEFVLITGIAKPAGFLKMAQSLGVKIREEIQFPDHHRLSGKEVDEIHKNLNGLPGGSILLSEKDAARWRDDLVGLRAVVLKVRLDVIPAEKLDRFLEEIFSEARRCSISG